MNSIRELRKERNLTQIQLAEMFNVDQTAVSKWELNKAVPETKILIKLSDYFDVSIDYLLGRTRYYYPDQVSSVPFKLTKEEIKLIGNFRSMRSDIQSIYLNMSETLLQPPETLVGNNQKNI